MTILKLQTKPPMLMCTSPDVYISDMGMCVHPHHVPIHHNTDPPRPHSSVQHNPHEHTLMNTQSKLAPHCSDANMESHRLR